MITPMDNLLAIGIVSAGFKCADCFTGGKKLAMQCHGLTRGDRFLSISDSEPFSNDEIRRKASERYLSRYNIRGHR